MPNIFGKIAEHFRNNDGFYFFGIAALTVPLSLYNISNSNVGKQRLKETALIKYESFSTSLYGFDDNGDEKVDRIELCGYKPASDFTPILFKETLRTGDNGFDTELARLESEGKRR